MAGPDTVYTMARELVRTVPTTHIPRSMCSFCRSYVSPGVMQSLMLYTLRQARVSRFLAPAGLMHTDRI